VANYNTGVLCACSGGPAERLLDGRWGDGHSATHAESDASHTQIRAHDEREGENASGQQERERGKLNREFHDLPNGGSLGSEGAAGGPVAEPIWVELRSG
jgi:hypothetical protein